MPQRLRPSAPIAADAVLTGDPGRAMMLAQELTGQPKMSNHARGLWGYLGLTPAGRELTIQSTGTGGPSAALVLSDLAELGLARAVRVGTCVALGPGFELGEVLEVASVHAGDGVSRSLGNEGAALEPSLGHFGDGLPRAVRAASFDLVPEPGGRAEDYSVADLQTAALLSVAPALGVRIGVLLVVAEVPGGERITDDVLEESCKRAGRLAAAILST